MVPRQAIKLGRFSGFGDAPLFLVFPVVQSPCICRVKKVLAGIARLDDGRPAVLFLVSLSEVDRQLLQRCLDSAPRAWPDFVDRFLGLVVHVANHTAKTRGVSLDLSTRDDLVAEVFLALVSDDFAVLRRFRRNCSLATYLTVISRRIIVRRLIQIRRSQVSSRIEDHADADSPVPQRIEDREEVQQLMLRLDPKEANVVRMFHLEGKSYREISEAMGLSENTIGPVLTRARDKMRRAYSKDSDPTQDNGRH